ncbi:alpha/beta hydrolase [Nitriliruptor alkaliphilus]|uniref:alpha/beta hydrolase n=1 Tax=Nitriliruptor alkaliphilus TaxID=427918 RepID=UPI0006961451|nr:alpha/beta hydrolase [Nitriliruptor alkaliphilus]
MTQMTMDPEIAAVLMAQAEAAAASGLVMPERGDAFTLRAIMDQILLLTYSALPDAPDVSVTSFTATAHDGADIELRWYTRKDPLTGPAVVYIHGGGMICGTLDTHDGLVRHYVQLTGVPFLAVGYRLAPEFPGTIPAQDAFAAVQWMVDHAVELGVDPGRIALMGDSGGGGVGAGAAILARDNGVHLSKQILIYPMLDDRNTTPDPLMAPTATWTYDNNYTGWTALLGDDLGGPDVSPLAAPARLSDFRGLAPSYVEVAELDIFRDESIAYAQQLLRAGVSCELHVHPGGPHVHDWLNPNGSLSRRVVADRVRVITTL